MAPPRSLWPLSSNGSAVLLPPFARGPGRTSTFFVSAAGRSFVFDRLLQVGPHLPRMRKLRFLRPAGRPPSAPFGRWMKAFFFFFLIQEKGRVSIHPSLQFAGIPPRSKSSFFSGSGLLFRTSSSLSFFPSFLILVSTKSMPFKQYLAPAPRCHVFFFHCTAAVLPPPPHQQEMAAASPPPAGTAFFFPDCRALPRRPSSRTGTGELLRPRIWARRTHVLLMRGALLSYRSYSFQGGQECLYPFSPLFFFFRVNFRKPPLPFVHRRDRLSDGPQFPFFRRFYSTNG